ncbi:MAG TPA: YdeI/OmpD-associated family protein [Polyangiaceae bacterium]|nr:YdeI/OmpD-associated family protein [Polyangiaceae bacterium]
MSDALPSTFHRALREDADARAHWQKLAPSHRKEYATWITSAKRPETAERRVVLAVEKLRAGTKTPMRSNDAPAVSAAPLGKKLGIKPETRVVVVASADTERAHVDGAVRSGPADLVIAFARDVEDLGRIAPRALAALAPGGVLWIAYRKKGPGVKSDLSRDQGWDVVTSAGWQAVSLVAVDSAWSALRFKNAGR